MNELARKKRLKELLELYKYEVALTKQHEAWDENDPEASFEVLSGFHFQKQLHDAVNDLLDENDLSPTSIGMMATILGFMFANVLKLSEDTHSKEVSDKVLDAFFKSFYDVLKEE